MSDAVRVERVGRGGVVARVVLGRPATRNALDPEMSDALTAAFAALGEEPADALRVVVLAGEGPVFCAGADVAWMRAAAALPVEANVADALGFAAMLRAIEACPVPVIARVQGAALGGGAGLCAVADLVVAEAGARFGFPEVRLGLVPATIAPFVVRRIGEGAARALFTTGARFDAAEALRIGLVNRVAPGEEALDAAVDDAVRAILGGAPGAVRAAKALAREMAPPAGPPDAAERTARLLAERRATGEAAEGLRAFEERRTPAWARPGDGS